jgi:hypothetical protein
LKHKNGRKKERKKERNKDTRMRTHTHTQKPVCKHEDVTVLWNQEVHTYREVLAKRSDIIIKNTRETTCILIDVAIAVNRNAYKRKQKRNENKMVYI